METVGVFGRVEAVDERSGIEMPRDGELDNDSMDFWVAIELINNAQGVGFLPNAIPLDRMFSGEP